MARIRVINPEGISGTIDDRELQLALSSGYTIPGQQSGGLLKNVVSSLISPFKRTAQRVVGATQEIGLNRAGRIDEANALINEATRRIVAGDTSPEIKSMLDRAEQLAKASSRETVATRNQQELTDPLQMLKDSLAMISWGVPAKGIGNIGKVGTRAIGGATAGFGYSPEKSAEGLIASTLGGAGASVLTGAILDKLLPAKGKETVSTIAPEESNWMTKRGYEAKRDVIRPQAGGSPESIIDEDAMMKYLNEKGITGTPSKMRYGVAKQYNNLYNQVGDIIDAPGATRNAYDVNTVKNAIIQQIENNGSYYIPGDPSFEKLLNREMSLLSKKAVDGYISDKAIYETLGNLNKQLSSAFKKVGGTSSSAVTQIEGVRLDTRQALTDLLGIARPELQPLTREMSMLHKIAPGLKQASQESINIFGFPISGPAQFAMGAKNRWGDLLLGLGGKGTGQASQGTLRNLLSTGAQVMPPALPAAAIRGKQPTGQVVPSTGGITPAGTTPTGTQGVRGTDILSQLGLDSQSLMLLQLLPVKEQNAILADLIGSAVKGGKETENIQLISDAAARAYEKLSSGSVKTGAIGGRAEKVKGQLGLGGNQETLDFNVAVDNLFAAIAKARGGTALTASEKQLLKEYLPQTGDSKQILETKLRYIIQHPEVVVLK